MHREGQHVIHHEPVGFGEPTRRERGCPKIRVATAGPCTEPSGRKRAITTPVIKSVPIRRENSAGGPGKGTPE
jgi:hypothetical protein